MSRDVLLRSVGEKPLYRQIAEVLNHEISTQFNAGEFLDSESSLAQRFGVNRHTLRRAIDELAIQGLVSRQHGRRIMVNKLPVQYVISSHVQFSKNMEALGVEWDTEVIGLDFVEPSSDIEKALKISHTNVVLMQTLRRINQVHACLTSHYVIPELRPVLESYQGGSLHDYFVEQKQLFLNRQHCAVSVALADAETAMHLQMPAGGPLMCVESINVNRNSNEPVELSKSLFRGDLVKLNIAMKH